MPPQNPTPYYLLAVLVQLVWGLTPSASKVVLDYLPVEIYSAIRYSFSGILFLVIARLRHGGLVVEPRMLPRLVFLGIVAYGLDSLGTLYGLKLGGVLSFALASSLNALITSLVSLVILKEKMTPGFFAAVLLSVLGGLMLFFGKAEAANFRVAGLSLFLIWMAYVCEALGFVFSRRYKAHLPLEEYLGILQVSAGIFMTGISILGGRSAEGLARMPWEAWASLAFVCFIACGVCYFLLYWLLNFIYGHRLAFFDAFHTLSASVLGVVVFHDPYNFKMVCGGALLLAAVWVVYAGRLGDAQND